MESGDEIFHDIRKTSHIMEPGDEIFHDIHKTSHTMEPGNEKLHDIQKFAYIMEIKYKTTPYGTWSQNQAPFFYYHSAT